ncbi:hypothetical protein EW026_g4831 [Hermanssonia centrifuga]|uniref:Uncharacterized protein n=1 Tax=Hermanssonia centrifuga TaxID=98765 RepID=A0A4S4KHR1_9APHY|nr:hypothetical protein EW026_g4831 [Hermanssonia centrifuga]
MFAKTLLVAFLSLSLSLSAIAAPANDFHNKGNNNAAANQQCAAASVSTVTVTAAATAAAATDKGSNNAAGAGAAGNQASSAISSASGSAATLIQGGNTGKGNAGKGNAGKGNTGKGAAFRFIGSSGCSCDCQGLEQWLQETTRLEVAAAAGGDLQSSLSLDPSVVATGFANNGQDVPAAGQVASLTSSNNFINFCATVPNLPITNGLQVKTGSCNPAPMGIIAATTNMPSSKFVFPVNMGTVQANTAFTIQMAINNLETGNFVNANENYFAAPQQVNSAGNVAGHSHVVIEAIDAIDSTTTTDPTKFAFFKGLNDAAQGGILSADVSDGLPAGVYRLASINSAANHQPVLVAVAQHGSLDDMIYFTVTNDGAAAAGSNSTAAAGSTAAAASAAASAKATAASSGAKGAATAVGNIKGGKKANGKN